MLLLCLKIFLVRIIDVSIGTVRMIFVVKEKRFIASILAFTEALIWFLVIREALTFEGSSLIVAISFAGGFGVGTYIGGFIAKAFIPGKITLQVFVKKENKNIINEIREKGYALTAIEYKGIEEKTKKLMIYINVDKKREQKLRKLIRESDPNAFIVANESKYVENGYFK